MLGHLSPSYGIVYVTRSFALKAVTAAAAAAHDHDDDDDVDYNDDDDNHGNHDDSVTFFRSCCLTGFVGAFVGNSVVSYYIQKYKKT